MMKFSGITTLLLGLPVVAMTACSSPQHATSQPGTLDRRVFARYAAHQHFTEEVASNASRITGEKIAVQRSKGSGRDQAGLRGHATSYAAPLADDFR